MNRVTCCLFDGKPSVGYVEKYVPKSGDIVIVNYKEEAYIGIYGARYHTEYNMKAIACLKNDGYNLHPLLSLTINQTLPVKGASIYKSYPHEDEVMQYLLNNNGYELVGDEVRKKRWLPVVGETYYYFNYPDSLVGFEMGVSVPVDDEDLKNISPFSCFKTQEACQYACDKLNELLLTLPQR